MSTCHNMHIIVQTTGGYASSLNDNSKIPDNTLDNITRALRKNFGDFPISIPSRSPAKVRIGCMVILLLSFVMYQDHHTHTSKYVL